MRQRDFSVAVLTVSSGFLNPLLPSRKNGDALMVWELSFAREFECHRNERELRR